MGLSAETKESYKAAAEEHIKDDEKVSEKVRKHTEAEFDSIGKAMITFLEVGGGRKHDDRIKEAILREAILCQIGCFFTHCVKGGDQAHV